MSLNENLTLIHENAFGFARGNLGQQTHNLSTVVIMNSGIERIPYKLLNWTQELDILIYGNPANCDPEMDWLFRNPRLRINKNADFTRTLMWCKLGFKEI